MTAEQIEMSDLCSNIKAVDDILTAGCSGNTQSTVNMTILALTMILADSKKILKRTSVQDSK